MKRLFLIRHAKTEDFASSDFERRLLPEGNLQCEYLGEQLVHFGIKPDFIMSSDAVRTTETANLLAKKLMFPSSEIQFKHSLYNSKVAAILQEIERCDNVYNTLYLIAHNNGISEAVNVLAGTIQNYLSPAGTVGFTFETDTWNNIGSSTTNIIFHSQETV